MPAPPEPWPYDSTPLPSPPLYALGVRTFPDAAPPQRKILLVNKRNANATVTIPEGGTLHVVDPASVGAASADGIRQEAAAGSIELLPFAVGVLVLGA